MIARGALVAAITAALPTIALVGCGRDGRSTAPDATPTGPTASGTAKTDPRPAVVAADAGFAEPRGASPRIPAGLRLLAVRGLDGGATLTGAGDPATLLPGDRVKPGDPVTIPAGATGVFRSADLGLELEVTGPARFRVNDEETVFLAAGEIAVKAAPRAPGAVATPQLFTEAPPGLRVSTSDRETVVTPAERTPATVWQGDPWTATLAKALVRAPEARAAASPSDRVKAAIERCQKEAAGARAAWQRTIGGGAKPAVPTGEGDAYAAHAEARRRARAACDVARAVVFSVRPGGGQRDAGAGKPDVDAKAGADLATADALWRELPGRADAGIRPSPSSSR